MIEVKQVKTYKQKLEFVKFSLKLYKGNKYFVPPIFMDELALFKRNCIHNKTCDQIFFLAYENNKVVGRIQGIIQRQYNEIHNCKKARFSRFDSIDNQDVATALLKAVEDWAKSKNMQEVIGPMGYNDLERDYRRALDQEKRR